MARARWWADTLYYEGGSDGDGSVDHPDELYPETVLEAFHEANFVFRDDRILIPFTEDPEKEVIVDERFNQHGPLAAFHDEYDDPRPIIQEVRCEECDLYRIHEERMASDKDLKILITARNGQLGVGKSTLAVTLAKYFDETWSASDRATFDAEEYRHLYQNEPEGSVLLFDDVEQALNKRRAMSEENVEISKMLEGMRFRQMTTIFIAPSIRTVDTWLRNLVDLRINVVERGTARVYEQRFDDFDPEETWQDRLHRVHWNPLDDDPDYQELQRKKKQYMTQTTGSQTKRFDKSDVEDAKDEAREEGRKEKRDEIIEQMDQQGYSQKEIADIVGLSQPTVSQIINS